MMASCVFRVRLVEMGKPSPPDAFTKRSSHCLRSVVVLHFACEVPHLVSLVLVHFIRGILACLKNFSRSSRSSRLLHGVEGHFQLRGCCSDQYLDQLDCPSLASLEFGLLVSNYTKNPSTAAV